MKTMIEQKIVIKRHNKLDHKVAELWLLDSTMEEFEFI